MNIKQIIKLNEKFYQLVSKDFSKTRQRPWKGWDRVGEMITEVFDDEIKSGKDLSVLDLGCGNGRFYDFIKKQIPKIKYAGVDTNNDLLNEAQKNYSLGNNSVVFNNLDIFNNVKEIKEKYNVVVAFGITHHVPVSIFRNDWFKSLLELMNDKSILILTFWDFEEESGDYLLGWSDNVNAARFCHKYSHKELDDIIKEYESVSVKLIEIFNSDKENHYLIFGKI